MLHFSERRRSYLTTGVYFFAYLICMNDNFRNDLYHKMNHGLVMIRRKNLKKRESHCMSPRGNEIRFSPLTYLSRVR
jgi:hypothetical protein